jgi:microcystin-dependent protein
MSQPFLSEIRIMSFGFPPKGWALCNGQLLPINQNQALFSLLGTTYGGDGRVNFALPNLQGQVPLHMGTGYGLGQKGGEQNHTLTFNELPTHTHVAGGSRDAGSSILPGPAVALGALSNMYGPATSLTALAPDTIGLIGGSQPHVNMQPFLTLSFCIALEGIFPSRN